MVSEFSKMEVNLGQVNGQQNFSFEGTLELPESETGPLSSDIKVNAVVTSMGSRYLLAADLECNIHGKCDRCLEDSVSKVCMEFEIVFQREEDVKAVSEQDEGDFVLLSGNEEYCYDISQRVKESVLLNLPMKMLCKEDCKGICPICGANLNIEDCGCEREEIDPRWAPLKDLLNDDNNR